MIMDALNKPLFGDDHRHEVLTFNGKDIDIIKTANNIWLYGPSAMEAAGVPPRKKDGYSRPLGRIAHPDKIKITDTPFRFPSGNLNRNRSVLVSPQAVFDLLNKTHRGRNPIMTIQFTDWLTENVLEGLPPSSWSPARKEKTKLEPVFRETITEKDQSETGEELDPLRPVGLYPPMHIHTPIAQDEVEFCLCADERAGLGKCWCRSGVNIRGALPAEPYTGDLVIDDGDLPF
ncbi:hypothetical protein [Shimia sp. SDUM112013]|uniref:hypothetical protein n=1 Tax=Shimia sp. SDUM112013 TaxID=3136160 RepID=UPI0032EAC2FC